MATRQEGRRSQDDRPNHPQHTYSESATTSNINEQNYSRSRDSTALSGPGRRHQDQAAGTSPTDARTLQSPKSDGQGSKRTCRKCNLPLTGQFVRALGGTFHLDCFKCRDCGTIVAQKFFPVDDEVEGTYPLCETDYFRRLDLLCHACGGALRGSYITALDRKYHIEHFTCCVCPTVFGPQDSYYEHDGQVYCHYHYSTKFAARCQGCQTAILKQFVEIFRGGFNQHWHPECYMIHKFWNVKLAATEANDGHPPVEDSHDTSNDDPSLARRSVVRNAEEDMEQKVYRIWSVLSTFEESSAANISDMLLHVSNGSYVEGVFVAEKFIWHVEILFSSADNLDIELYRCSGEGLAYSREAKLLCKKIVAFFTLLSKTQETGVRKLGVTQELLSLVTGLAHYLKLLIRISLQGALRIERDYNNPAALDRFLNELADLENAKESRGSFDLGPMTDQLADLNSDLCSGCNQTIEDECARHKDRRWHIACFNCANCSQEMKNNLDDARWIEAEQRLLCRSCSSTNLNAAAGFEHVTKLKQYVYLLRVALARLLSMLKEGGTIPHASDNLNLNGHDADVGQRIGAPGILRSESRSKSYQAGDSSGDNKGYGDTVANVQRLRSTRLDQKLVNSAKRARQSRLIDDGKPSDREIPGEEGSSRFRIVEDRDINGEAVNELTFGDERTLTLDDIPRIAATEQARELRPNAFKHRQSGFGVPIGFQPKLVNGHQRGASAGNIPSQPSPQFRQKRYFSELSALEYFIVRHIACMSMLPLVEDFFNLEELLDLIERTGKPTFWNKFGKALKGDGKTKKPKKNGVFGVSLDLLIEKDGAESSLGIGPGTLRVPAIVDDAISAMKRMDMSVEGVFRKNGNIRRLKELTVIIDNGDNLDLGQEGAVQVAALLKKFLRELPDPLLTFKLHQLFITSQKLKDEEKKKRLLHLTCCLLPKTHRDSVEILFSFLNWVASFSHVDEESGSKMDVYNLATVITPNILFSKSKDPGMDESFLAIEAVHTLIEFNDQMCEVPEDILSILQDPTIFSNSAELTTKDILKRYGEIAKMPSGGKQYLKSTEVNKDGRPPPAVLHRVETDANNLAWSNDASAHVRSTPPPAQPQSSNYATDEPRGTGTGTNGNGLGIAGGVRPVLRQNSNNSHLSEGEQWGGPGQRGHHQQQQSGVGVTGAS